MPSQLNSAAKQPLYQKALTCLESLTRSQLGAGSLVVIIHAGNSDYLPFLHRLISQLTITRHRVHVFDYHRRIKTVYLQQLLSQHSKKADQEYKNLRYQVILDEDHALSELIRLGQLTPSQHKSPILFLIDPSGLFERLRGGVKQSAKALQFQYEAAVLLSQKGYAVLITDFGGREFHRVEAVVPAQLAEPATMIVQFLPRRLFLS